MAAIVAVAVAIGVTGVLLIVAGLMPSRGDDRPSGPPLVRVGRMRLRWSRRRRLLALAGLGAGVVLWIATGWLVFLVGVPVAAIALPALLSAGEGRLRLARLDALESWTRSLAGLTVAGAGLEQTISASLSSTSDEIRPQVATLVARLSARWRTDAALRAFADDMADPTCDLVVLHLLLAERMRGPGLARALEDLADSIADEVRARRAIETDRAKPRQNTRIITVTTLLLLCAMPLTGSFMAPYATATGQALLAGWLAVYALVLVWLRRTAEPPSATRMLPSEASP